MIKVIRISPKWYAWDWFRRDMPPHIHQARSETITVKEEGKWWKEKMHKGRGRKVFGSLVYSRDIIPYLVDEHSDGKKDLGKMENVCRYTYLNKAFPKYSYLLPIIDRLIDGSSGFWILSFMDAYSRYNQIRMNPVDAPYTTLLTNRKNFYYNVMPSGLKN